MTVIIYNLLILFHYTVAVSIIVVLSLSMIDTRDSTTYLVKINISHVKLYILHCRVFSSYIYCLTIQC